MSLPPLKHPFSPPITLLRLLLRLSAGISARAACLRPGSRRTGARRPRLAGPLAALGLLCLPLPALSSGGPAPAGKSASGALCHGFGPQTPRDISMTAGQNRITFPLAPPPEQMNLCNIHTHTNAEHKGPGFSVLSVERGKGGYKCNASDQLTAEELRDPFGGHGAYHNVSPGDTIEVHWVYSSCQVEPGEGLGACLSQACNNPTLRVESQVFLVVNDPQALDFALFDFGGTFTDGHPQPHSLPTGTGDPVVFRGSTTGPSYTQAICSPFQVTWSVRPDCARLDISSLDRWARQGNIFGEDHSHGVREIVTALQELAPIE